MTGKRHLFRGFHPDENGKTVIMLNGEKIKGNWVYWDKYGTLTEWINVNIAVETKHVSDLIIIDETVGQLTGLFDNKGNKIFEGDVLEFNDRHGIWRASVVFERGLFGIDVCNVKQIKNPETWDKEYPITKSRGWGCAWGYEEFGTAFSYRKPLAQITLYSGEREDYENSEYKKLHSKFGWGNYYTMSAEVIGNKWEVSE